MKLHLRNSYVVIILPIYVKSWPKEKLGQVEVGSNIAQNHLFNQYEVICGHYVPIQPIHVKSSSKLKMKQAQNHLFST